MQINLVEEINKTTGLLEIQYFAKTDVGLVRTKNEDNFIVGPILTADNEWTVPTDSIRLAEHGSVFIVADGMGGTVAGQIASTIAVESIKKSLINAPNSKESEVEIGHVLNDALKIANKDIIEYADEHPECAGMGTTATICYIRKNRLFISWIGDSRVYRFSRNGRITSNSFNEGGLEILTDDHSLVWNDVLKGIISPEEARIAENSNVITQSLGDVFSSIKPDHRIYDLYEGDLILNCSDGLNSMISDKEISDIFDENLGDPKKISQALMEASLRAGGKDNITIVLMHVVEGPLYNHSAQLKTKEVLHSNLKQLPVKADNIVNKRIRNLDILNILLFAIVLGFSSSIIYFERKNIKLYWQNNMLPIIKANDSSTKIDSTDEASTQNIESRNNLAHATSISPFDSKPSDKKESDDSGINNSKNKSPSKTKSRHAGNNPEKIIKRTLPKTTAQSAEISNNEATTTKKITIPLHSDESNGLTTRTIKDTVKSIPTIENKIGVARLESKKDDVVSNGKQKVDDNDTTQVNGQVNGTAPNKVKEEEYSGFNNVKSSIKSDLSRVESIMDSIKNNNIAIEISDLDQLNNQLQAFREEFEILDRVRPQSRKEVQPSIDKIINIRNAMKKRLLDKYGIKL